MSDCHCNVPNSCFVNPFQNVLSQLDRLDLTASYIKELKDRIDALTRRKELATRSRRPNCNNIEGCSSKSGAELPIIQLREWHSGIDLSLVTGAYKNFTLCEVISILQEEGAEVISASFSTIGDKIFHTLHAQVCRFISISSLKTVPYRDNTVSQFRCIKSNERK